jgi:hypothetical protein
MLVGGNEGHITLTIMTSTSKTPARLFGRGFLLLIFLCFRIYVIVLIACISSYKQKESKTSLPYLVIISDQSQ